MHRSRPPTRLLAAPVISALVLAVAAPVASADPAADIAAAQKHWRELDYELVVKRAESATADRAASKAQRLEGLRLLGSALAVLGKTEESGSAFTRALAIDPSFDLDGGTSPRILSVFRPARARWLVEQERRLAMELGPALAQLRFAAAVPPSSRGGRPIAIDIRLTDPGKISSEVVVRYRKRGDRGFSTTRERVAPTMRIEIPPAITASSRDYQLELYIELQHSSRITIARRGSAGEPLSVMVAAGSVPKPPPVTSRWWFWTGAAALATAAVAIPVLIDRGRDIGPQDVVGVRP